MDRILDGRITVNGERVHPDSLLKEHDYIVTRMGVREEPPAARTLDVVYEDDAIRVFNKGAPLAVHPSGRYFKNSLTEILKAAYPDETPRPVQRLDALTTGLVVFAKSKEVATHLMSRTGSIRNTWHWSKAFLPKKFLWSTHRSARSKARHGQWAIRPGTRKRRSLILKQ